MHYQHNHQNNQDYHCQAVDIELCTEEGEECTNQDDAPFGHTACRQEQKLKLNLKMGNMSDMSANAQAKVLNLQAICSHRVWPPGIP